MSALSSMEKKFERTLQLLEELASEVAKGIPLIVEGKKDIAALNKLEIRGIIIPAKSGGKSLLNLLDVVEAYGKDEVILLMDFDRRGKELMRYMTRHLEKTKIKPKVIIWKELSNLLKRDVKDIEGLSAYIETLKKKLKKDSNKI